MTMYSTISNATKRVMRLDQEVVIWLTRHMMFLLRFCYAWLCFDGSLREIVGMCMRKWSMVGTRDDVGRTAEALYGTPTAD